MFNKNTRLEDPLKTELENDFSKCISAKRRSKCVWMFTFGVVDWHSCVLFFYYYYSNLMFAPVWWLVQKIAITLHNTTDYWNEIVIVMHPGISINVVIYRYILCGAAAVHKDILCAHGIIRTEWRSWRWFYYRYV